MTDEGAPLSHPAFVARELGILAVVGRIKATSVLKSGDRFRVDGRAGSVRFTIWTKSPVAVARICISFF